MKRSLVMLTIVALLGLPLAVWAETNDELFQPKHGKAEASVATEKAEKPELTTWEEIDSAPVKDAEKPRESVPSVSEMYAF